jgi:SAM-dependent methyltransferase
MSLAKAQPRAFIDFYAGNGISPVAQDISDLGRHFRRRDSLYRFLGLPPAFLRGRTVIEFGPGSGHNALFTASLEPSRYVLVDANPKGLADTRRLLAERGLDEPCEVVESLFENFTTDERFDLVVAEGLLSFQRSPEKLLTALARFVRPGGLLFITTMSPLSYLAEIARRLMRDALIAPDAPAMEQLAALRPLLGPHLAHLPGRSRPVDDWLLDNVVQPIYGELLSAPRAIAALAGEFDLHGGSPRYFTDLRWYKDVAGEERGFNAIGISEYRRRAANMADHRLDLPPHDEAFGEELEREAEAVWTAMQALELEGRRDAFDDGACGIEQIAQRLKPVAPETAAAFAEAAERLAAGGPFEDMTRFPALWGRGQQYLSFIRRAG